MGEWQRVLVGGGVRSGKSAFALVRARQLGTRPAFVATAEALDEEMRERVARHRLERGLEFQTHESPRELVACLERIRGADVVVIDCLTLWISNLLLDGLTQGEIDLRVQELAACLERCPFHSLVVTNEVGLGIVPDNALARAFRDATGRAHQTLGRAAHEVYFGVMGQLLRLKPGPVEAVLLGAASGPGAC
jgi:adenosylcobinamide kinase/adenosylcobinamide-phosphate guanylyltransferase